MSGKPDTTGGALKSYKMAKRLDARATAKKSKSVETKKYSDDQNNDNNATKPTYSRAISNEADKSRVQHELDPPPSPSREMQSVSLNRYKNQKRQQSKETLERINKELDKLALEDD